MVQGICRTVTNQELREPHKALDIVADIKKKRLEWIGHLARMDHRRVVTKIVHINWREEEWEDLDRDYWRI